MVRKWQSITQTTACNPGNVPSMGLVAGDTVNAGWAVSGATHETPIDVTWVRVQTIDTSVDGLPVFLPSFG